MEQQSLLGCLIVVFVCSPCVSAQLAANNWPPGLSAPQLLQNDLIEARARWQAVSKAIGRGLVTTLLETESIQNPSPLLSGPLQASNFCAADIAQVAADLKISVYAQQMLDAEGKIPSGVMEGHVAWYGDYTECQSIKSNPANTTIPQIHGRHCLLFMSTKSPAPITITLGTCVPDTCNSTDVKDVANFLLKNVPVISKTGLFVKDSDCYDDNPYTTGQIVALVVCGIIGLLVLVGTLIDVLYSYLENKGFLFGNSSPVIMDETTNLLHEVCQPEVQLLSSSYKGKQFVKMMTAFSFISNCKKLFNTSTATGPLSCVNGLRVLSMWWVIQGHTYVFIISFLDNVLEAGQIVQRFTFQAILNGTFSVDTFFFMSGLLVAFLTLNQLREKEGKLNWCMFYFHRYWRLTPVYAFVLMIFTTMMLHMGDSPAYYYFYNGNSALYETVSECFTTWWANLLYINNYYPNYGSINRQCMGWTWYLANDMQFYLISPILLWFLYRFRLIGVIITSSLTFACLLIRMLLVIIYQIKTLGGAATRKTSDIYAQNDLLYNKTYTRIAPFLVGILTGFVLYRSHCRVRLHKGLVLLGWSIAIATGLSVVYGLYSYNHNGTIMNPEAAAIYISTARFFWGVALAWVVFACATGYGGLVNQFLSWKVWAPLGRLTYCAYLVHPIIIFMYYMNQQTPIHFTDLNMVYLFFGNLVASYFTAFVVSMTVEAPMLALEKIIFKRQ